MEKVEKISSGIEEKGIVIDEKMHEIISKQVAIFSVDYANIQYVNDKIEVNLNNDFFCDEVFKDHKLSEQGKKILSYDKSDVRVNSLEHICTLIGNSFAGKFHFLNCFFLNKSSQKTRNLGMMLNSLPLIKFQADEKAKSIRIDSVWNSNDENSQKIGKVDWANLSTKKPWQKIEKTYKAKMIVLLKKVRSVALYEWGFEIKTAGSTDMVAVISSYLVKDFEECENNIGKQWEIPFNIKEYENYQLMIPENIWDVYEDSVDIEDLLEDTSRDLPNFGQRRVHLDIE